MISRSQNVRVLVLSSFAVLASTICSAAPVPFTGHVEYDFTNNPGGGSVIIGQHPAGTGTVIINGASGVVSPITKLTIPEREIGLAPGLASVDVGSFGSPPQFFKLKLGGTSTSATFYNRTISLQTNGTCAGFGTFASCPGGGLAGFGTFLATPNRYFVDTITPIHYAENRVGTGTVGEPFGNSLPPYTTWSIFFAGWTTGTVVANGATFIGSNTGSTLSLVSPVAFIGKIVGVPTAGPSGVVRLQINLQLSCDDGLISSGEVCDDGNNTPADGCDGSCQVEPGYTCTGAPSVCTPICGNGVILGGEACDDSNVTPGDGCSATCQIEPGFLCSGEPSVCTPIATILGKILLVKDPDPGGDATKRKVIVMGKESLSPDTLIGDPVADGAEVRVAVNGTTDTTQTFTLPPGAQWKSLGSSGFKYGDSAGANGPVKLVKIKKSGGGAFLLKVVIAATYGAVNIVPPNTGTDGGVQLAIGGGGGSYCVKLSGSLGGTVKDKGEKFFKITGSTSEGGCP